MWASDYFQVIHGDVEAIGELTVTGGLPYGTWMNDFGDNVNAVVAAGDSIGFLSQPVTLAGPTFEQMTLGFQNLPALSGTKVSIMRLESGSEIEVEDAVGQAYNAAVSGIATGAQGLMVTSGTGTLAGAALNAAVSFQNGRLRVAQTGDIVHFIVINPNVVPVVDTVNNLRIRFKKVMGYVSA